MTDAADIAEWMMEQIRERGRKASYQEAIVRGIRETFGEEWSYYNVNGNLAIDKAVLKEFNKQKTPDVLWDRSSRYWYIPDPEKRDRLLKLEARNKARRDEAKARRAGD